ncbi:MAG: 50S ribosomal protein L11 methyltransferase [Peptostreptococcaceae bacterium]|nr:50S ribosomal protein L11 methyltransferase [Peptostreptococcaceae bacterium]
MDWIEVKASVNREAVDAVTEIFYEFGAGGVSVDEPIEQYIENENIYWDYIDESKIDRNVESKVMAYYSTLEENLEQKIQKIKSRIENLSEFGLTVGSAKVETAICKQEDWENSWKQFFKPIKVTDKVVIKPQWEEYEAQPDEIVIHIDPGMAFGTGSHETTSMCIEALEKNIRPKAEVLDVGTGSGVLSIASALLGAEKIVGVDLDPVAVEVAKENILLNHVEDRVEIKYGDLVKAITGEYDIVVANIIAEAILILLDSDVKSYLKPSGIFICSGIIREKEQVIQDKLSELGFNIREVERKGEWICITSTI